MALYSIGGLCLIFTLFGTNLLSFESFRDASLEGQLPGISEVLIADRKAIFFKDSLRSLLLVVITAALIWAFLKTKINKKICLLAIAALILFDLVGVDRRYVNNEDFVTKKQEESPFKATDIDKEIQKDKSHYRVINFTVDPMNDGSTSYFHNSIGGYHAAKPRRYQELFDYQIARNNFEVLNMLNTKYIIFPDDQGTTRVQLNTEANGNAWFVNKLEFVNTPDEEILALDSLKTKKTALVNLEYKDQVSQNQYANDSLATIALTSYRANEVIYKSSSQSTQMAVFSEMYYPYGWNAYVDGKLSQYIRVNYVLRAMEITKGEHEIIFKFEPEVIKKGSTITLISFALFLLVPLGWFFKNKLLKKNESS